MKYIVTINGKNYEVEVEKGQATLVKTTQATLPVQPTEPASQPVPAAPVAQEPKASAVTGPGELIKAPMPGTILSVKVSPGSGVKRGDVLLILEAMKMENEISAPEDGVVGQILVSKGASVSTGDALLTLL